MTPPNTGKRQTRFTSKPATSQCAPESNEKSTAIMQTLAQIPRGHVATYGQIATLAGFPGAARYVGYCLKHLPDGSRLPWHRVLGAGGRLAFPLASDAYTLQAKKLQAEGIEVVAGKVDMKRHQWRC